MVHLTIFLNEFICLFSLYDQDLVIKIDHNGPMNIIFFRYDLCFDDNDEIEKNKNII
jgi:hypothetical protein